MLIEAIAKLAHASGIKVETPSGSGVGYRCSRADFLLQKLENQYCINDTSGSLRERLERIQRQVT